MSRKIISGPKKPGIDYRERIKLMILSFHPCFETDIQIIPGSRPLNSSDLETINRAEAIILPQGCREELYRACSKLDMPIFPDYKMRFAYPGKVGQSIMFENFDIPHPGTVIWNSVKDFKKTYPDMKALSQELPFFIKDDRSHEADGIFFINDMPSLLKALEHLTNQERMGRPGFVSQEYVASGGNVLRAVIIGKTIIAYWKRPGKKGDIITTISKGAIIDNQWRPDLQLKGVNQAQALSISTGINLAAVDFVFNLSEENQEPLALEINYFFGRRGLGGMKNYYQLLLKAIKNWLKDTGLDAESVILV